LPGARLTPIKPLLFSADFDLPQSGQALFLPHLRQLFPNAQDVAAESIRAWSEKVCSAVLERFPENQPWLLHVEPHYGVRQVHHVGARAWHSLSRNRSQPRDVASKGQGIDPEAGKNRCALIRSAVVETLRKKRRHLLKNLQAEPASFTESHSIVQVCLTAPNQGFISASLSPEPHSLRHLISSFPMGRVEVEPDKLAPSRAFAKLVESELRLGRCIQSGETCVDLGASPGSWTYVAAARGARVLAVDRAHLREDLMGHPSVEFIAHDAFSYKPPRSVEWLLCDVIVEPERSAELLLQWIQNKWTNGFIVTLKLKDSPDNLRVLQKLRDQLSELCAEFWITRLCSNKKEVCVFGYRE
jgi:23S rRNA (cytidine2498-2'-O)-methyltransferase